MAMLPARMNCAVVKFIGKHPVLVSVNVPEGGVPLLPATTGPKAKAVVLGASYAIAPTAAPACPALVIVEVLFAGLASEVELETVTEFVNVAFCPKQISVPRKVKTAVPGAKLVVKVKNGLPSRLHDDPAGAVQVTLVSKSEGVNTPDTLLAVLGPLLVRVMV